MLLPIFHSKQHLKYNSTMKNVLRSLLVFFITSFSSVLYSQSNHTLSLGDSVFLMDGNPFQIISGEMHYPRIPREAWRDRMKKAKAMGLNTVGTYVFWNVHEPQRGHYDFSGNNDIAEFVKIAKEEGLWVILRPSPYVCAEWEFGGYPYWLQNIKGLEVRSKEPQYLQAYRNYIMQVGKQLAPLQINHGGNILMVQIENEYGAYGSDKEYLDINRKMFIDAGFDGLLYTCDPEPFLARGNLPGLLPAINGQDKPSKIKPIIKAINDGKGPFFVAEWYPAWFDWWGTQHHTVPAEKYTPGLDSVLSSGMSINMYMFHGGTTRGFMNGANFNDTNPYEPQISSYDYDAPLDEAGNVTEKFVKFRKVIEKNLATGQQLPEIPNAKPSIATSQVVFTNQTDVFNLLPAAVSNLTPLSFEDLNQAYGYVLYRTTVNGGSKQLLKIKDLRDYGIVFINGKRAGILDRRLYQDSLLVDLPKGKVRLDILVENLGRINYGPYLLKNKKGITEKVLLNGKEIKGWQMFKLPFNNINVLKVKATKPLQNAPVVKKGYFIIDQPADTYLDFSNWGKGVVWVNGHNLGKYWEIGPQQTVYVPVEWLKPGKNDIVIFELIKPQQNLLHGVEKPILNVLKQGVVSDK
jgi:beta-galactosidase